MYSEALVSVICLCHNHAPFVEASIRSALYQDHKAMELIVVDDASTDGSKEVIKKAIKDQNITFIDLPTNVGNCKAFNKGLLASRGEFVIDLAADDLLFPKRVSEGLKSFNKHSIGVEFCNVQHLDEHGNTLNVHFKDEEDVPAGDLYELLIKRYFISPPSMMMKRSVLEALGGYNEALSYEDFDFWIRSSRNHRYGYTNQVLVGKRELKSSYAKQQFSFLTKHQRSTLEVCRTIKALNKTAAENQALKQRIFYEIRNCIRQGNLHLIPSFIWLL